MCYLVVKDRDAHFLNLKLVFGDASFKLHLQL